MAGFDNPFDPYVTLSRGCSCGHHRTQAEHDAASVSADVPAGEEARYGRVVESAVMRALFPQDSARRRFLQAVGSGTALSAISALFPLATAKEVFAQTGGERVVSSRCRCRCRCR